MNRKRRLGVHEDAHAASGAMSDINITPLIDVMLVLLIIFMVVTPLAQKGLDISLPQPPPPTSPSRRPPPTRSFSPWKRVPSPSTRTPSRSRSWKRGSATSTQARSDKTIFVRATGAVPYGRVVQAMDLAKAAGVERIGIISDKMIEEAGGVVGGQP